MPARKRKATTKTSPLLRKKTKAASNAPKASPPPPRVKNNNANARSLPHRTQLHTHHFITQVTLLLRSPLKANLPATLQQLRTTLLTIEKYYRYVVCNSTTLSTIEK